MAVVVNAPVVCAVQMVSIVVMGTVLMAVPVVMGHPQTESVAAVP